MTLRTIDYATLGTLGASVLGGVFFLGSLNAKIEAIDTQELDRKLQSAIQQISDTEYNILNQLPVGTVIASVLEPNVFLSSGRNKKWHLADGSAVPLDSDYKATIANTSVVDQDRLPDLRGVFLRGMNAGRADGKQDPEGTTRKPGDFQNFATAAPRVPFSGVTDTSGEHNHTHQAPRDYGSGAGDHARAKPDGSNTTSSSGEHTHAVTVSNGGDAETRPANVALYFYIKVD